MRKGDDLPPTRTPLILGLGLATVTGLVIVLLLLSRGST